MSANIKKIFRKTQFIWVFLLLVVPSTSSAQSIATWGDSLTYGFGGTPYPTALSNLLDRSVYNGGVSGQTSTYIKLRMLAATDMKIWPVIIWAGENNWRDNAPVVEADIAQMIASLKHDSYMVLSILNPTTAPLGSDFYNQIAKINTDLAATYKDHFLDVRSYLISQYNPNSPSDVQDHQADVTPASLRYDGVHLNTLGYQKVAQYIAERISVLDRPTHIALPVLDYTLSPTVKPATLPPGFRATMARVVLDARSAGEGTAVRITKLNLLYNDKAPVDPIGCNIYENGMVISETVNPSTPSGLADITFPLKNPVVLASGSTRTFDLRCSIPTIATSGSFAWGVYSRTGQATFAGIDTVTNAYVTPNATTTNGAVMRITVPVVK